MTVALAVHAHPDDVENLCAGTLALLSMAGVTVKILTATAGEGGSDRHSPQETAAIRKAEGRSAAGLIHSSYDCLELPDLGVFNDEPTRRRVTCAIRAARPDLVLAPSPVDYHPDHEAVSILVRDACFASSVPNYQTGSMAALGAIPHLYYMDPIGGRDRAGGWVAPDFAVDIQEVMDIKRQMLKAHESQHSWVAKQHGLSNVIEAMERWSQRCGRDFHLPFAEGFRQYRHHPYPHSPLLQTLLSSAVWPRAPASQLR